MLGSQINKGPLRYAFSVVSIHSSWKFADGWFTRTMLLFVIEEFQLSERLGLLIEEAVIDDGGEGNVGDLGIFMESDRDSTGGCCGLTGAKRD